MKFRWPWSKRAPAPVIPPHKPDVSLITTVPMRDPGIHVEEHDVSAMTRTGIHKAWDRLAGKFKGEP